MSLSPSDGQANAREQAFKMPLEDINLLDLSLWRSGTFWPYFERLRQEDPVHWHPPGQHRDGPFWSVTRYEDIVAVDTNHSAFSSEGSIVLDDPIQAMPLPMFIAMDPPKHDEQRRTVQPIVAPEISRAWKISFEEESARLWTNFPSASHSIGSTVCRWS